MNEKPIHEHEGKKYLRKIVGCTPLTESVHTEDGRSLPVIEIDIYAVIKAFNVTCPGRQQALKKLLATGERGKGDVIADLRGALAATNRAVELAQIDDQINRG